MQRILITGANRGLGFELTRQCLRYGEAQIFATCRRPERADQLKELARKQPNRVTILQMDINDESSINAAVKAITAKTDALDVLVNNAGIFPKVDHPSRGMGQLSSSEISNVITTNAVSPLIVTQACRGLLKRGLNPRVVMISSGMGLLRRAGGNAYGYRMSKAAMNMAARVLASDEAMAGITTISVNPGWVRTDMGGPAAHISAEESASGLLRLINRVTPADTGKLFQYDGAELPW